MAALSPSALSSVLVTLLIALLPGEVNSQDGPINRRQAEETTGTGKTIYCYQCNSGVDADCASLLPNNTNSPYYLPCNDYQEYDGEQPFCRKIEQTIFERENMVRVIRKCGWEKHPRLDCYFFSNDDHVETVCQCFSDGCNSAPRGALSAGLGAAALLAYSLVS